MHDNVEYAIEWLQRLHRNGSVDPEIQETNWVQALQKFAGGIVGVLGRNADTNWVHQVLDVFHDINPGDHFFDRVTVIPPMSRCANTTPRINGNRTSGGMLFSNSATDAQVMRYLAIHDWMLTDEATVLLNLGFEGEHHTVDANGRFQLLTDPATGAPFCVATHYNAATIRTNAHWGFCLELDPLFPHAAFSDETRAYSAVLIADRDQWAVHVDLRMAMISTPAVDTLRFNGNEEFTTAMTSPDDPRTAMETLRARMIALGVNEAIREANEAAQRLGIEGSRPSR
jgi:hypothetical protein